MDLCNELLRGFYRVEQIASGSANAAGQVKAIRVVNTLTLRRPVLRGSPCICGVTAALRKRTPFPDTGWFVNQTMVTTAKQGKLGLMAAG
jgi:hypothetical protein